MLASTLFTLSLFFARTLAAEAPVFVLSCDRYPDVCDTHCYALACAGPRATNFRDVNRYLHYAPDSSTVTPRNGSTTTEATYRRQAIGCGSSTCATDHPGTQCDEFPYASTYDGGLGCITDRYHGTDPIARSGITHCASGAHNGRHGSDLQSFYIRAGLRDNQRFQIGFNEATVDNAQGCRMIRQGKSCGEVRARTGEYHVVTDVRPRTYCQRNARRSGTNLADDANDNEEAHPRVEETTIDAPWDGPVKVTWPRSVDAHGNVVLLPYHDESPPAMTSVFHVKRNGRVLQSHIV